MKRIFKYLLLMIMSIFCLNSCILGTAVAGTYLLGTMGTYYCAEYSCTPTSKLKEKDSDGVKIFVEKKPLEVKSYFESIKKRGLVKIKGGKEETFVINLPKNFILKKMETGYYLYDEEKKIGFFSITDSKDERIAFEELYNSAKKQENYKLLNTYEYKFLNTYKGVFTFIIDGKYTYRMKKISEHYYAYYEQELQKEAHEIYDYLIENL